MKHQQVYNRTQKACHGIIINLHELPLKNRAELLNLFRESVVKSGVMTQEEWDCEIEIIEAQFALDAANLKRTQLNSVEDTIPF